MNNFNPAIALRAVLLLLLLCAASLLPAPANAAPADERCFGAAGQGCGSWPFLQMPRPAFCTGLPGTTLGVCLVHGGSLTHDPCCARNPNGKQCGGNESQSVCTVEWDKSVRRAVWNYQWARLIDTARVNNSGVVERPLYCGTSGSGIHRADSQYCCSGKSREGNFWERLGRPSLNICR